MAFEDGDVKTAFLRIYACAEPGDSTADDNHFPFHIFLSSFLPALASAAKKYLTPEISHARGRAQRESRMQQKVGGEKYFQTCAHEKENGIAVFQFAPDKKPNNRCVYL